MANQDHLAILSRGVEAWNAWRDSTPEVREPDLSLPTPQHDLCASALLSNPEVDLRGSFGLTWTGINLVRANMCHAALYHTDFRQADLAASLALGTVFRGSDFSSANLCGANFTNADLRDTKFLGADLSGSILSGVNLTNSDLTGAKLRHTDLRGAILVGTNLSKADLTGSRVYGVAAWGLNVTDAIQNGLLISDGHGPEISVDDIELGQFLYLLIDNARLRKTIDTITSKVVLVLGRFTKDRKAVLDQIRQELLSRQYVSVIFDFEQPTNLSTDETVTLLARMAKFVIADVSDAKSVLQELRAIVPDLPSVPIQPIILQSQEEPGMFDFFRKYPWVLPTFRYSSIEQIIEALPKSIIGAVELRLQAAHRSG